MGERMTDRSETTERRSPFHPLTESEQKQREALGKRLAGRPHPATRDPNWLDDHSPPLLSEEP